MDLAMGNCGLTTPRDPWLGFQLREPPRQPLRLPANFIDKTAERVGTVIAISGATGAGKVPKVPPDRE
jgi:hypothetical protein